MIKTKTKKELRLKRRLRYRSRVFGKPEQPRVCIFIYCSRMFEFDKEYSELAVNFKLKPFYKDDFVILRRSMVDYQIIKKLLELFI